MRTKVQISIRVGVRLRVCWWAHLVEWLPQHQRVLIGSRHVIALHANDTLGTLKLHPHADLNLVRVRVRVGVRVMVRVGVREVLGGS